MKESKNFFVAILQSLNFRNYKKFVQNQHTHIWQYFFSIIFIGLLVLVIVAIPLIAATPKYVESKLKSFDEFSFSPQIKVNSDVNFPNKKPMLVFSPNNNATIKDEMMLITSNKIQTKFLFDENTFTFNKFSNIKDNAKFYGLVAGFIFILMLPMLLLFAYIFFVFKFFVILMVFTAILFAIARIVKFDIKYRDLVCIGVYAMTVLVIPNMIFTALRISIYHIEYLAYILFLVFGMLAVGKYHKKRMIKADDEGYIEIH